MQQKGFKPIVGKNPKILILGSMPSVISLQRNEYYGHAQNVFWKIMRDLFYFGNLPYKECVQKLKTLGICLWDIVHSCARKGSNDSNIKNAKFNPIKDLLVKYPSISRIYLNGRKAESLYNQYAKGSIHLPTCYLPSTSPLHTISYQSKLKAWSVIRSGLDQ